MEAEGTAQFRPLYPGPAYRIVTPRLVIRCWQPPDARLLLEAITVSQAYLAPWMPWALSEPTDLQTKIDSLRRWRGRFDLGEDFMYGIFNRDETQVLGGTGLHNRLGSPEKREIGYWIHKDHAGQGLATENVAALTRVGFEVELLQRIEIRCDPTNLASRRVIEKAGYHYEGTLRGVVQKPDGSYRDQLVFSLLPEEHPASPNASIKLQAYDIYGRQLL